MFSRFIPTPFDENGNFDVSVRSGAVVFGEAIAAGIASDGNHYFDKCWQHAAAHVLSPPLRTDTSTGGYLLDMLSSGQLHLTGSDHAVFNSTQKELGKNDFTKIPNGVNGLEERMMLVWEKGVVILLTNFSSKLFVFYLLEVFARCFFR